MYSKEIFITFLFSRSRAFSDQHFFFSRSSSQLFRFCCYFFFCSLSVYQWNGNNVCFCGLKCQNIWILWCQAKGNRKIFMKFCWLGGAFFHTFRCRIRLFWLKFHSSFPFSFWFDTIKIFSFGFDYGTSLGKNNYSHRYMAVYAL